MILLIAMISSALAHVAVLIKDIHRLQLVLYVLISIHAWKMRTIHRANIGR